MVPSKKEHFLLFQKGSPIVHQAETTNGSLETILKQKVPMLPRNAQHPVPKQFPRKGSLETLQYQNL